MVAAAPSEPSRPAPPRGVRRGIVLSDAPLMRAGLQAMVPRRTLAIVGELEGPEGLVEHVAASAATVVLAAPSDGGDERLFRALDALPPHCAALVLLSVPGFRIQAATLSTRFDIVCLPLNVGLGELRAGISEALAHDSADVEVEEICAGAHGLLSGREQEVLRELAQGKTNRDIAESLWLAEDTVKSHLRRVYRKLGVGTRSEAVALYIGQLGSA